MKIIFFLFALWGNVQFLQAQTISADSVAAYEGKTVTVCEKIVSTHVADSGKVIYLNFGHPYPAQSFTGVIFQSDLPHFPYNPAVFLEGKTVCITGVSKIYKGKPEIIINKPEQLQVK